MMAVDRDRLREELLRMKSLIEHDPKVRARFDTDGNGVIDGEEWEAVRQLVIQRLEREQAEIELAQQTLAGLDPQQAAELARMEAAMAAEDGGGEEETLPDRDWDNLELAFDPRSDALSQRQSVAESIYERELAGRVQVGRHAVRMSEHGTLADCHELILEQGGGAKQFFGNLFRREYIVRDANGDEVGRVGQRENEALQNLTDYSFLEDPDLNFAVHDGITGEQFNFRRTSGLTDNSIAVYNPNDMIIARTSWTLSFLRRKYEVRVVREGVSYGVRRQFLRPWTYDVLDPFDEPIGVMQRGWSGLGFLTGGNRFHIDVDADISPDAMWGFLAAALLADLDNESNSRSAGVDLFND